MGQRPSSPLLSQKREEEGRKKFVAEQNIDTHRPIAILMTELPPVGLVWTVYGKYQRGSAFISCIFLLGSISRPAEAMAWGMDHKLSVQRIHDKKLSGKIKSQVQSFQTLEVSWKNSCEQISMLLQSVKQIVELMECVTRASRNSKLNDLSILFPDLFDTIEGQFVIDIEDAVVQIKMFLRNLGDVEAGMKQCSLESAQLIVGKHIDEVVPGPSTAKGGASTGYTFSVEDVLSLQTRQYQYSNDFMLKEYLINKLMQSSAPSIGGECGKRVEEYWLDGEVLAEVVSLWDVNQ